MDAIVYTSNAGSTEQYARLLSEKCGLPAFSLAEARRALVGGAEIIYLGWIMASSIKGYAKAAARYDVRAVCGVGMLPPGAQDELLRDKNALGSAPLFPLRGDLDPARLHGAYKLAISIMIRAAGKGLSEKTDRTPEEDALLDAIENRTGHISPDGLAPIIEWLGRERT